MPEYQATIKSNIKGVNSRKLKLLASCYSDAEKDVNSSLTKLDSALSDQTELLVVNRKLTESIDGLKGSVSNSNDQLIIELRAMTSEISNTKSEIQEVVSSSVNSLALSTPVIVLPSKTKPPLNVAAFVNVAISSLLIDIAILLWVVL